MLVAVWRKPSGVCGTGRLAPLRSPQHEKLNRPGVLMTWWRDHLNKCYKGTNGQTNGGGDE